MRTKEQTRRAGRTVPYAEEAEMALLGAALLTANAFEVAMTEVVSDDLWMPAHQHIHGAMRHLYDGGHKMVEAVLVWEQLRAMALEEHIPGGPSYLVTLQGACGSTANVGRYARIVLEMRTRRDLIMAASDIQEEAYESSEDIDVIAERATRSVEAIGMPTIAEPSMNVLTFMDQNVEYDWIIEGLLERRDRLIVTGGEGDGKSALMRQLAVTFAAGMHPFWFRPVRPVRVLLVDAENPQTIIARQMRGMVEHIRRPWEHDNLRIEARADGLDLMDRHHVRWLIERVAINQPDVLIIGPVYRLHSEDESDGMAARKVARVFELLRSRFGCAVILEHHAPHGAGDRPRDLRPVGASLWKRWPEFGYGMRVNRDADPMEINGHPAEVWFNPWKGAREQRQWPRLLSGDNRYGWPWRDAEYRAPDDNEF